MRCAKGVGFLQLLLKRCEGYREYKVPSIFLEISPIALKSLGHAFLTCKVRIEFFQCIWGGGQRTDRIFSLYLGGGGGTLISGRPHSSTIYHPRHN
jgi:hypothetical protein